MSKNKTVQQQILEVNEFFAQSDIHFGQGTETALDEAAYLVSFVAELPPDLPSEHMIRALSAAQVDRIWEVAKKRVSSREPLAYLLGKTWYRGLPMYVNRHSLIPRSPIGELLQEQLQPWVVPSNVARILDLCCGGGSLGILAASQFPEAKVDLVDVDVDCIRLAQENCILNELTDRVRVIQSDLFQHVPSVKYDIILSNPPYVPIAEQAGLPTEFQFEPAHALFAGNEGLDFARKILVQTSQFLSENGILVLEVGQARAALDQLCKDIFLVWAELEQGGEGVCIVDFGTCRQLEKIITVTS